MYRFRHFRFATTWNVVTEYRGGGGRTIMEQNHFRNSKHTKSVIHFNDAYRIENKYSTQRKHSTRNGWHCQKERYPSLSLCSNAEHRDAENLEKSFSSVTELHIRLLIAERKQCGVYSIMSIRTNFILAHFARHVNLLSVGRLPNCLWEEKMNYLLARSNLISKYWVKMEEGTWETFNTLL